MTPSIAYVLLLRQSAPFVLLALLVGFAVWRWRSSLTLRRRADALVEWLDR